MVNDLSEASVKLIVDTVRDALRNDGPTSQPGVLRLPEDERLRALVDDILERKLAAFEKRVEAIVHKEIADTLRNIGVRIDDEHIDQTADEFRSMMKTHRNINRLATGLGFTLITGVCLGIFKLLGLNLPNIGGER